MADLTKDIQYALTYIEANLTRDLEVRDIAKQAYLSPFYFQRIFGALCGISVGEYIRSRRLSLAGDSRWMQIHGDSRRNLGGISLQDENLTGYKHPDVAGVATQWSGVPLKRQL